ncbi:lanthionine synthetase LanC family protein [Variovorax saccharolyticus]|uniref:lanthionine synthetase LanC family protein n=1 Tax=Variovorax saccharolyticus TaxID=3053516 RepID=UPI002574CC6A|nr:lanthionine synthetase LanC family protein [Variovorax sp. J31P216]MDM0028342.1 lanthionine synthetase LanC family protein [Variovorax sp. J31P216]
MNEASRAITRPQSRIPTHILSASTAKLLQQFREPVSIVDAIITFSGGERATPNEVLLDAFPVLQTFVESGLLLPSDSHLLARIEFLLNPGDRVGDLVIEQSVSVVLDTEVYRARTAGGAQVALKIGRLGSEDRMRAALAHEADVLTRLDGRCSPRLVAQGDDRGRPYVAMEWCNGVDALAAADLARQRDPFHRRELKDILLAIVTSYAQLHHQQMLHGDVHPRNVLIASSGKATLLDFGQARLWGETCEGQPRGRGGVDLYMEPELARARASCAAAVVPSTPAGEQYAIAALLYALLTGSHTHDFVLDRLKMLQQVAHDPPKSFAERGVQGFAQTERTLRRALKKAPKARFASVGDFATALSAALELDGASPHRRGSAPKAPLRRDAMLDGLIARSSIGAELIAQGMDPPTASVNFGAAGLAFTLLKIAQQRRDGSLLAAADVWSESALRDLNSSGTTAFTAPDLDMSSERLGTLSLYHAAPGVLCVAALVANAQADHERRWALVERFVAAASGQDTRGEIVLGLAGLVIGCGLLLQAVGHSEGHERNMLRSLGESLNARLHEQLSRSPAIEGAGAVALGVAHGVAGMLYAMLQWSRVTHSAVPDAGQARLEDLARVAQPLGRGLVWPVTLGKRWNPVGMRATWCNGSAGHVHLWLLAHEVLGTSSYLDLALSAAWTTYESPSAAADLCCGSAGRAYALLHFFRKTGDRIWLTRAHALADHAAASIHQRALRTNSLYRGQVGVCLLAAELHQPEAGRMPLFELD